VLAALALLVLREERPSRRDVGPLLASSLGVVIGFPLFTALALEHITAARGMVFTGLLPLATALFGVLRAGESLRPAFWLFALCGSALVIGYAVLSGGGDGGIGDVYMLVAIVVAGAGYAEGARLSRRLGGWQVICWSLVLSFPVTLPFSLLAQPDWSTVGLPAIAGLAYVSLFSMLLGFVFWYTGLAQGGIAAVGQMQLLQPLMGLALAAAILGETVGWNLALVSLAVVGCVAGARQVTQPARPAVLDR
jgi:drug/metabolite transporter (DMT)-like permease